MKNKLMRLICIGIIISILTIPITPTVLALESPQPPTQEEITQNTSEPINNKNPNSTQQPIELPPPQEQPQDIEVIQIQPDEITTEKVQASTDELLQIAQSDGAKAAEILNAYTDSILFQAHLDVVLKYYYESKNEQLAFFTQKINSTALSSVEAFALAAQERETEGLPFAQGEILVVFENEATFSQIEQVIEEKEAQSAEVSEVLEETFAVVEIALDQTVEQAITEYTEDPRVKYAQPNYVYTLNEQDTEITGIPNDSGVSSLWYLNKIQTIQAWDFIDTLPQANKVRIAVLDTGLEIGHPDLQANINKDLCVDTTSSAMPYPKLTRDANGVTYGHGTHVAGIIGATSNNNVGSVGIASGNKNNVLELFVVDVFTGDTKGASTDSIVRGINYAVNNGAKALNMSLGLTFQQPVSDMLMEGALSNAVNRGTVVVVSAGNETNGTGFTYPADYEQCISVIALDEYLMRASYSNWGAYKDISAPGSNIYNTGLNDAYVYKSGTSMASPVLCGVVAMMLYANHALTVNEVKTILYETATDIYAKGKDNDSGWGFVNAYSAVVAAKNKASNIDNKIILNVNSLSLVKGDTRSLTATAQPALSASDINWTTSDSSVVKVTKNANGTSTVSAVGKGNAVVSASSAGYTSASCVITVLDPNSKSIILSKTSLSLNAGASQSITANINPYVDPMFVSWSSSNTAVATVSKVNNNGLHTGNIVAKGNGVAQITVSSNGYPSAVCTVTVSGGAVKLQPPTSISLQNNGDRNVYISWNAVSGANGYSIFTSTDNVNYSFVANTANTNYTHTNAQIGKTNYYKVMSTHTDSNLNSDMSAFRQIKIENLPAPTVQPTPLSPPNSISLSNSNGKNIYISWSAVAGASSYCVYKSNDGVNYSQIADTYATNYTDTSVQSGVTNYYKLMAVHQNSVLNSTLSYAVQMTLSFSDDIEGFVDRSYSIVLGRNADQGGKNNWVNVLKSKSSTGAAVAHGFVFSEEYISKNTSNNDFVEMLFKYLLNRPSDSAGKKAWVNFLEAGMSREYVFSGFIGSPEFTQYCKKIGIERGEFTSKEPRDQNYNVTDFVSRLYKICLDRTPEPSGLNAWTNTLLNKTATGSQIAYGIFFSKEFTDKGHSSEDYVEKLYLAMMGRGSDGGGKSSWVKILNDGKSRLDVFRGFVYSQEFTQLCNFYGILRGDI